jgi:hypothetical protein
MSAWRALSAPLVVITRHWTPRHRPALLSASRPRFHVITGLDPVIYRGTVLVHNHRAKPGDDDKRRAQLMPLLLRVA